VANIGSVKAQIARLEKKYGCDVELIPATSEDYEKSLKLIHLRNLLSRAGQFFVRNDV